MKTIILIMLIAISSAHAGTGKPQNSREIKVGSKKFTESVILGEIVTQLLRTNHRKTIHIRELGGTRILWNALLKGDIDIYPEYTGTIKEEIFGGKLPSLDAVKDSLSKLNIDMSGSLGFNDSYALGMRESLARKLGIRTISDLKKHPELKFGFSNEFMDRKDGWPGLREVYRLPQKNVAGMDHDLAYRGLEDGSIDVVDLYSTDAEIEYYHLAVLKDDKHYFPEYNAVLLYRGQLKSEAPGALKSVLRLEGTIPESSMIKMNAEAKIKKIPEDEIAAGFIKKEFSLITSFGKETITGRLWKNTKAHLYMVFISLTAAILISIPLGIISQRKKKLGKIILGVVGVIQTIPSLALLVFMIPLLGIGAWPAITALFLYSLLPIVRNTYSGLEDISSEIRDSAEVLGLKSSARLRIIELPLASRSILAGIKISAVINVGTATLGALIGAGGYGQPILTGIRLDDVSLILQGAVPAAVLALAVQMIFDLAERIIVPKGLML